MGSMRADRKPMMPKVDPVLPAEDTEAPAPKGRSDQPANTKRSLKSGDVCAIRMGTAISFGARMEASILWDRHGADMEFHDDGIMVSMAGKLYLVPFANIQTIEFAP